MYPPVAFLRGEEEGTVQPMPSTLEELRAGLGDDRTAVLNCLTPFDSSHNVYYEAALCSGVNDWLRTEFLERDPRLRASLLVPTLDPDAAVEEIERLGSHPGFVQVLLPIRTEAPWGNKRFHRLHDAAVQHGLVLGLHAWGRVGNAPTTSGFTTSYLEDYATNSQIVAQAHVTSLVSEGCFERTPELQGRAARSAASPGCRSCSGGSTRTGRASGARCRGSRSARRPTCCGACASRRRPPRCRPTLPCWRGSPISCRSPTCSCTPATTRTATAARRAAARAARRGRTPGDPVRQRRQSTACDRRRLRRRSGLCRRATQPQRGGVSMSIFQGFERATSTPARRRSTRASRAAGRRCCCCTGYPQTRRDVARGRALALAEDRTVVVPDLRGYGASSKPARRRPTTSRTPSGRWPATWSPSWPSSGSRASTSPATTAARACPTGSPSTIPSSVTRLAVLDIIPTSEMSARTTRAQALAMWHWFFLPQPYDLPERLLAGDPEGFYFRGREDAVRPGGAGRVPGRAARPGDDPHDVRGLPGGRDVRPRARRGRQGPPPDHVPAARALGRAGVGGAARRAERLARVGGRRPRRRDRLRPPHPRGRARGDGRGAPGVPRG